jgi:hypothetical protein
MKTWSLPVLVLAACSLAIAQQPLTDASIAQLVKAGLSEDLILTSIASSPGNYDMSPEKLVELKQAGVSDKVLSAMMQKANAPAQSAVVPVAAPVTTSSTPVGNIPRVYLESKSKGNRWAAARDQSMEMGKDFDKNCPTVKITVAQNNADYTVYLSHIEVGFARDNQMQIANRTGDLIAHTKEGGGISNQVKKACADIMADWAKATGAPLPVPTK